MDKTYVSGDEAMNVIVDTLVNKYHHFSMEDVAIWKQVDWEQAAKATEMILEKEAEVETKVNEIYKASQDKLVASMEIISKFNTILMGLDQNIDLLDENDLESFPENLNKLTATLIESLTSIVGHENMKAILEGKESDYAKDELGKVFGKDIVEKVFKDVTGEEKSES